MTDVKEQRICIKFFFKLGKTFSETHRMLKDAFGDNALKTKLRMVCLSVSRTGGYQLMMKSVLDDLRPEPVVPKETVRL